MIVSKFRIHYDKLNVQWPLGSDNPIGLGIENVMKSCYDLYYITPEKSLLF